MLNVYKELMVFGQNSFMLITFIIKVTRKLVETKDHVSYSTLDIQ